MEERKKRFIGIDLAKKTYEVRILSERGKVFLRWNGKTDLKGRKMLIGYI
jgi:hypothetical protein